MTTAAIYRVRSGGAVLDDGSNTTQFPDWREAAAEAAARGLHVPQGVPPLLPPAGHGMAVTRVTDAA